MGFSLTKGSQNENKTLNFIFAFSISLYAGVKIWKKISLKEKQKFQP